MNHLLHDQERYGSHDRAAAARKANTPWRRGLNWLSGGGCRTQRINTAKKRERIADAAYPGAHKRPGFRIEV